MGAAVAEVVGSMPHQLHRLAERLGRLSRLQSRVEEQVPAERAAALHDVAGDRALRQAEELGDGLLRDDR